MKIFLILALLLTAPAVACITTANSQGVQLLRSAPGPQDHSYIFRENVLRMVFNVPVDPKNTTVSVKDEQNREVAFGIIETSLTASLTVRLQAPVRTGFDAGAYTVKWNVEGTEGSYGFHVRKHH